MFSTILDKATVYFDRRMLVSAFFPSLVFWLLIAVAFVWLQMDWKTALQQWDTLSGTLQFLCLFAFFIWVIFWSLLTTNFRTAFIRLYEGYWPKTWILDGVRNWRCGHWRGEWKKLDEKDHRLEGQEAALIEEKSRYRQLTAQLTQSLQSTNPATTADTDNIGQDLDKFLDQVTQPLQQLTSSIDSSHSLTDWQKFEHTPAMNDLQLSDLLKRSRETRDWWEKMGPWLAESQQQPQGLWSKRYKRLEVITRHLMRMVDEQYNALQVRRQSIYRELSLYYPQEPSAIMPTRLGNILKAIELYSWKCYHLDAVIIWPRLQYNLPSTFAEPLQDAKTSLDLMITLAAFCLFFGLPLSIWTAVRATSFLPWWFAFLLALLALAQRLYPVLALILLGFIPVFLPHATPFTALVQTLVCLVSVSVLLSHLSYQSAIQAALDYGEKIKAAFDLYRWQVLDTLHVQLPTDFVEERKTWEELCGLLARNYAPDPHYYRYEHTKKTEGSDASSSANKNKTTDSP